MKIEIEFESSYEAKITIDGREMKYSLLGSNSGLHPFENENDRRNTIGGIVAHRICDILPDILQGWIPENESPRGECWETWELMDDETADQVYDKIN